MPANSYNWVPDELVETANGIHRWLQERGYTVKVEHAPPGFPYPPTFVATRGKLERVIVEIAAGWQEDRIATWLAYAKSCQKELKIYVGIPENATFAATITERIRKSGVGLLRVSGGDVAQELEAADASVNVSLPPRGGLHQDSKALLGAAYDHFEGGRFREGFEESCKGLELSAKRYLKKWIRTGRIRFVGRSGTFVHSDSKINGMTLGALEIAFEAIQAQNSSDRMILNALRAIRKDRNKLTHDKWNLKTERRLRTNVGQHMWIIVQALVETYK